MIWIIFAVLSFIGGQVYLFHCLTKLDAYIAKRETQKSTYTYDDSCRYSLLDIDDDCGEED